MFRHIEFLRNCLKSRFLVIIVSPDGDVQNRVIFTELPTTRHRSLLKRRTFLNTHYAGMAIEQVRERLQNGGGSNCAARSPS